MLPSILLALIAATGTEAFWLSTANMDYYTNVAGTAYPSPYCQVGKGNTREESYSRAISTTHGTAIIAGGHCDQLPYKHTNQLGGFWDDYGTINYEDDNWHWYCSTGSGSSGSCDAGNGAPKKKRAVQAVEFKA